MNQALALARRNKWQVAVMSLDIDHFKSINVSLGHDIGDFVLKAAANRLKACMRESDTVARLGGDGFIIMLSYIKERDEAAFVAHRIRKELSKVFIARDQEFSITVSIGISVYPSDGENIKTLLKNADVAMEIAKEQGGDRYEFYTP
jgi:diguanylate cyclase (GGDEF)-like protein